MFVVDISGVCGKFSSVCILRYKQFRVKTKLKRLEKATQSCSSINLSSMCIIVDKLLDQWLLCPLAVWVYALNASLVTSCITYKCLINVEGFAIVCNLLTRYCLGMCSFIVWL